jgi:hypothetical protein
MDRTCCFPGCTERIDGQHLACKNHWFSIPKRQRQEIQARHCGWKSRDEAINYLLGVVRRLERERLNDDLPVS